MKMFGVTINVSVVRTPAALLAFLLAVLAVWTTSVDTDLSGREEKPAAPADPTLAPAVLSPRPTSEAPHRRAEPVTATPPAAATALQVPAATTRRNAEPLRSPDEERRYRATHLFPDQSPDNIVEAPTAVPFVRAEATLPAGPWGADVRVSLYVLPNTALRPALCDRAWSTFRSWSVSSEGAHTEEAPPQTPLPVPLSSTAWGATFLGRCALACVEAACCVGFFVPAVDDARLARCELRRCDSLAERPLVAPKARRRAPRTPPAAAVAAAVVAAAAAVGTSYHLAFGRFPSAVFPPANGTGAAAALARVIPAVVSAPPSTFVVSVDGIVDRGLFDAWAIAVAPTNVVTGLQGRDAFVASPGSADDTGGHVTPALAEAMAGTAVELKCDVVLVAATMRIHGRWATGQETPDASWLASLRPAGFVRPAVAGNPAHARPITAAPLLAGQRLVVRQLVETTQNDAAETVLLRLAFESPFFFVDDAVQLRCGVRFVPSQEGGQINALLSTGFEATFTTILTRPAMGMRVVVVAPPPAPRRRSKTTKTDASDDEPPSCVTGALRNGECCVATVLAVIGAYASGVPPLPFAARSIDGIDITAAHAMYHAVDPAHENDFVSVTAADVPDPSTALAATLPAGWVGTDAFRHSDVQFVEGDLAHFSNGVAAFTNLVASRGSTTSQTTKDALALVVQWRLDGPDGNAPKGPTGVPTLATTARLVSTAALSFLRCRLHNATAAEVPTAHPARTSSDESGLILVSVPVHECPSCMVGQLRNIAAFAPRTVVLFVLAPGFVLSEAEMSELHAQHPRVIVNPRGEGNYRGTRYLFAQVKNLQWFFDNRARLMAQGGAPGASLRNVTHLLWMASNELILRRGLEAYIARYNASSFLHEELDAGAGEAYRHRVWERRKFFPMKWWDWPTYRRLVLQRDGPPGILWPTGHLRWPWVPWNYMQRDMELARRLSACGRFLYPAAPVVTEGTFLSLSIVEMLVKAVHEYNATTFCESPGHYPRDEVWLATLLHGVCDMPGVRCGRGVGTMVWQSFLWVATSNDVQRVRCSRFEVPFTLKRVRRLPLDAVRVSVDAMAQSILRGESEAARPDVFHVCP